MLWIIEQFSSWMLSIQRYTTWVTPPGEKWWNRWKRIKIIIFLINSIDKKLIGCKEREWIPSNFEYHLCFIKLYKNLFSEWLTNGSGDWGSIPGQVIPKIQKIVLDASLLNTQHYKVRIKGKVEQSRERSSVPPYTSM